MRRYCKAIRKQCEIGKAGAAPLRPYKSLYGVIDFPAPLKPSAKKDAKITIFREFFGCFPKRYPLWWWIRETSATGKWRHDLGGHDMLCPYNGDWDSLDDS
jgi:hypothetical protein